MGSYKGFHGGNGVHVQKLLNVLEGDDASPSNKKPKQSDSKINNI